MYADDTVLVAESAEGLQTLLDGLLIWTKDYGLKVNVAKTKVTGFQTFLANRTGPIFITMETVWKL